MTAKRAIVEGYPIGDAATRQATRSDDELIEHVIEHLEALQRLHGRVHFAGEHTTVLRGTMDGAVASGRRAAREVDEAAAG